MLRELPIANDSNKNVANCLQKIIANTQVRVDNLKKKLFRKNYRKKICTNFHYFFWVGREEVAKNIASNSEKLLKNFFKNIIANNRKIIASQFEKMAANRLVKIIANS